MANTKGKGERVTYSCLNPALSRSPPPQRNRLPENQWSLGMDFSIPRPQSLAVPQACPVGAPFPKGQISARFSLFPPHPRSKYCQRRKVHIPGDPRHRGRMQITPEQSLFWETAASRTFSRQLLLSLGAFTLKQLRCKGRAAKNRRGRSPEPEAGCPRCARCAPAGVGAGAGAGAGGLREAPHRAAGAAGAAGGGGGGMRGPLTVSLSFLS